MAVASGEKREEDGVCVPPTSWSGGGEEWSFPARRGRKRSGGHGDRDGDLKFSPDFGKGCKKNNKGRGDFYFFFKGFFTN